ncbi:ROK family transcriptional regulator [Paenibacillus hodogayensis]|uniref:ROK family transcriptional regulator n=1 Tax=Paenibacillus hodogayensis TaxID=279208 RepID=A0ABV5VWE9_9BACL
MIGRAQPGSTKLIKRMNRENILLSLKANTGVSRADLAKLTELSRPCVSSLVDEMIQEGLIHEIGMGTSKGGRKPILLEYNFAAFGVVGAVFEGSTMQLAIADLKGDTLYRHQISLSSPMDGEKAIESVAEGLKVLLARSGFDKSRLLGIGLGLPGITRRRDGTISYAPSTGWMGLPVRKEIEEKLGLPVIIDNDVNLMTLGEYRRGAGIGYSNLVYMYVGTGIGAGIVIDKQLYRGAREASGEIGYMMIGPIGKRLQGEFGVFEKNYSVSAVREKARYILPYVGSGSIIRQIADYADRGMKEARQLLDDTCKHWAIGIANMASMLDPELLILSGELIHLGEEGLHSIKKSLSDWVPSVPELKLASLGEHAGIMGAIHSVLEAFPSEAASRV